MCAQAFPSEYDMLESIHGKEWCISKKQLHWKKEKRCRDLLHGLYQIKSQFSSKCTVLHLLYFNIFIF